MRKEPAVRESTMFAGPDAHKKATLVALRPEEYSFRWTLPGLDTGNGELETLLHVRRRRSCAPDPAIALQEARSPAGHLCLSLSRLQDPAAGGLDEGRDPRQGAGQFL